MLGRSVRLERLDGLDMIGRLGRPETISGLGAIILSINV
jgi:replicative superfamily II helicase